MRLFLAQFNPKVGALQENTRGIITLIEQARAQGGDLIVFPELAVCGYPPQDLLFHPTFISQIEECLALIQNASKGISVIVGLPRNNLLEGEKPLRNSAALIVDGELLGFQDKVLLPSYSVFNERRYFEPGGRVGVWEIQGKKVGVLICEDVWHHAGYVHAANYSRDPVLELESDHPDLLVVIAASPYHFQKMEQRVIVCKESAETLKCPVAMCSQVGGNDQLVFDGYSLFVSREGKVLSLGKGFKEELLSVGGEEEILITPDPLGDLYKALVLGVRDYFHKQGFKKACLGISGGIDSALTAAIVVDALGSDQVVGVSMPSRYTSSLSKECSKALCHNLGIPLKELWIEVPFKETLSLLEEDFQGRDVDVTEENMQARIRGLLLMALSNKFGYIIVSTGNKSEMALGYATLYGDMCGGLAALCDVTKTQVYQLANWVNLKGERIPRAIIERPPSAELKFDQKDSDSLPDYEIIDTVLHGYVEEHLSPSEIERKYQIDLPTIENLIRRIHLAEYKRKQAPPGIRVSERAFQVGRHYPIVQGWDP